MTPRVTIIGKPLCDACAKAEVWFTARGFAVTYLSADTVEGLAWLAEHDYPLDETLVLPVWHGEGW